MRQMGWRMQRSSWQHLDDADTYVGQLTAMSGGQDPCCLRKRARLVELVTDSHTLNKEVGQPQLRSWLHSKIQI